eukprot:SAG11_NODE_540_length_8654_cov_9.626110_9_plen_79_part_00
MRSGLYRYLHVLCMSHYRSTLCDLVRGLVTVAPASPMPWPYYMQYYACRHPCNGMHAVYPRNTECIGHCIQLSPCSYS